MIVFQRRLSDIKKLKEKEKEEAEKAVKFI